MSNHTSKHVCDGCSGEYTGTWADAGQIGWRRHSFGVGLSQNLTLCEECEAFYDARRKGEAGGDVAATQYVITYKQEGHGPVVFATAYTEPDRNMQRARCKGYYPDANVQIVEADKFAASTGLS